MLQGVTSFHDEHTPDLGLVPVVVGHADGPQHGPGRRPLEPVGDLAAAGLDVDAGLALSPSGTLAHGAKSRPVVMAGRQLPHDVTTPARMSAALTRRVDSTMRIVARVSGTRLARSILSSVSMASNR